MARIGICELVRHLGRSTEAGLLVWCALWGRRGRRGYGSGRGHGDDVRLQLLVLVLFSKIEYKNVDLVEAI